MGIQPYKNPFRPGEVLIVYFHQQPAFFVRVENITPDIKKGWWRLHFITLTFPIESVTWILDDEQIRGAEFTMEGHPIRLQRIHQQTTQEPTDSDQQKPSGNIVSLFGDE